MSVRRALVECVVLSLQDACVFYPCCKGCFSRIDVEQQDTTRCRCSRCGYSCQREQAEYRYRLSLKVARDGCIFGVTVFGTSLNPFFGIHASGLQRLVENFDGPVGSSTRSTLLVKAVKDCFIGRRFIFGIKITEAESRPWAAGPVTNGSSRKEKVHFIASQMILPKAGLEGCTVVSYYQILLQRAAEYELGSTKRPPATALLLIPCHSPANSFNDTTLSASGLLPRTLQRSQSIDSTFTPTPPWQQSLGLITSSAEQEEGCNTQDSGDENSRQTGNNKIPHHAQSGCLENHEATEETALSPLLSLECSSYSCLSFPNHPSPSTGKVGGNTPNLNTWFSPSSPDHSFSEVRRPTGQLTKTFLSSSLAWEDLPFSESLTEFLCEEDKDFDIVRETEPHLNQKETARTNLEILSQDKNKSIESTCVCQSNTQVTESHSLILDVTTTPAPNGGGTHELSDQVRRSHVGRVNQSQPRNICSNECEQEKASSLSFENEEEQLEGDTYNCSADLFSSSPLLDMNTNTHAETVSLTTEAPPPLSTPHKQHLKSEKAHVPHTTADKQKLDSNKCINRGSLIPPGAQELDFIPDSQSTPIVKAALVTGSPASSRRTLTFGEFALQPNSRDSFNRNLQSEMNNKNQAKITSFLCTYNCASANQLSHCSRESAEEKQMWSMTSSRHSHRCTPKRRFWRPDRHKNHLQNQQHRVAQRRALKARSTGRINHQCDPSDCDVTVCDYENSEVVAVPPTPVAKRQWSVKLRGRSHAEHSSSIVSYNREGQHGDGVNCKRTLLDQTLTLSQGGLTQIENCDSETVDKRTLDGSSYLLDDENEACDWSRDLFSD
ncbi:uncharacterized protein ddias [Pempheris klunzingeri]|uniref:uncharacterized protein ddias n=1 Tax=Pempheris klunzingeri TaxID=3127111 RepID=UPI00397F8B08